jgi:hypothetical protein
MNKQLVIRNLSRFSRIWTLAGFAAWFIFAVPPAFPSPDSEPCSANSPSRQLDFWLGDWNITYPGAPGGSTSKVSLSLDKCELVETWDDGQGHKGENRFAYNYENKSWRGMFADNRGHVHVFVDGQVSDGSAEFLGPSRGPNGETIPHRIKVFRVSADKVKQVWEKSADNGATWTTVFQGEYSRKTP